MASNVFAGGASELEDSPSKHLGVKIEVFVISEVGRNKPICMVRIVSTYENVDHRRHQFVELDGRDGGGLDTVENNRINLRNDSVCLGFHNGWAKLKSRELSEGCVNPFGKGFAFLCFGFGFGCGLGCFSSHFLSLNSDSTDSLEDDLVSSMFVFDAALPVLLPFRILRIVPLSNVIKMKVMKRLLMLKFWIF